MLSRDEPIDVREPPGRPMGKVAELWRPTESGRIVCTACARYCKIGEGQVGLCGIRGVHDGKLWLYVYGKVITGHVDPIEKKPVTHYRPGSKIFSIATTGCNWLCHPAGTQILLADGDVRPVEEVRVGDVLSSLEGEACASVPDVVTEVGTRRARVLRASFDGLRDPFFGTAEHPVLTHRGWVVMSELRRGDLVLARGGDHLDEVAVSSPVRIPDHSSHVHPEATVAFWRWNSQNVTRSPALRWAAVENVTSEGPREPVYSFECVPFHNYVADGIVVHNCRYCQNADISQRRKVEGIDAQPDDIVKMTLDQGCQGIAYTYNQPTIFMEFARDIGIRARKAGLINIFVSNGYDTPETVAEMKPFLDCITVDFKGSGETQFVRKYISIPNADPIFDTLKEMRDKTKVHIEITDLIVPQVGDDLDAARRLAKFVYDELGPDTPIHFLRFHPDYKMNDLPWTPVETLEEHCRVAKEAGLRYVYVGNVPGHPWEHTYCPACGSIAVKRYGFDITAWNLGKDNRCKTCDYRLPIVGSLEKTVRGDRFYSVLRHA